MPVAADQTPPDILAMPATRRDVLMVLALLARDDLSTGAACEAAWERLTLEWRGHGAERAQRDAP